MNIVILGWYGTETIGDRGILAGLLKSISSTYGQCNIAIGSLYPFFTVRTINEDYSFWKIISGVEFNISLFETTDHKALRQEIMKSDLVVMGGGPLMHINELYMVEFAFRYAKKINKKTAILGCGVGPIFNKKFHRPLINIIYSSDLVILRDKKSLEILKSVADPLDKKIDQTAYTSLDPALISCVEFSKNDTKGKSSNSDYICINLRAFPCHYSSNKDPEKINDNLKLLVTKIAQQNTDKEIKLVPMHYFHIGDDDRVFLNKIAFEINESNVTVQNRNLDLSETMSIFSQASFNLGMRFHSVVFQTMLSGRNYIIDYTEPGIGKISSFLTEIDPSGFYSSRYINLQEMSELSLELPDMSLAFHADHERLAAVLSAYERGLGELF